MLHQNIRAYTSRSDLLSKILICMGMLDELISGFLFIGLPLVRNQLGLSYEHIGLLFTVGACSSMLLDPILTLLGDRGSKRWWILVGFLGLAIGLTRWIFRIFDEEHRFYSNSSCVNSACHRHSVLVCFPHT